MPGQERREVRRSASASCPPVPRTRAERRRRGRRPPAARRSAVSCSRVAPGRRVRGVMRSRSGSRCVVVRRRGQHRHALPQRIDDLGDEADREAVQRSIELPRRALFVLHRSATAAIRALKRSASLRRASAASARMLVFLAHTHLPVGSRTFSSGRSAVGCGRLGRALGELAGGVDRDASSEARAVAPRAPAMAGRGTVSLG